MTDAEIIASVKQHLGVDYDDDDTEINLLVAGGKKYVTNAKGIDFDPDNPYDMLSLYCYCNTLYKSEGDQKEQIRLIRGGIWHDVLNKAMEN